MLPKIATLIATIMAIGMSLFHLKQPLAPNDVWSIRLIHLSLGMAIAFLIYPVVKNKKINIIDLLLAGLALSVGGYILIFMDEIIERFGMPSTADLVMGAIAIILVLEMTRRVIGLPMVVIAVAFLLYAYFGNYMPGALAHKGYSISRIIDHLYLHTEGIYGVPIGVSATFVILFIIFGAFLQATKTGDFFMGLANSVTGTARGGPAKIAVLASALFGTISGSAVANVVATGSYTIPLMKRTGYKPHFAGAVEATASSGGQIMPPIMGAAAFVMAEFTGIPYITICLAAVLPAILYFAAVQIAVHLEAVKTGLTGLSKEEIPSLRRVFISGGHLLIPLLVLIYLLAVEKMTPMAAAFWSIVSSIVVSSLRKETRMSWRDFFKALEDGAKGALTVVAACACAGIIIGVITLTGLGLRFTGIILEFGAGSVILTLILTMITCYILGMGVPTTAAYIITAVIAAPALIKLGVPVLAAHLFVFYSALLSAITPPVALAAYAGAGIAGSDPMRTAFTAMRIGWMKFFIPYYFVYLPPLLIIGSKPLDIFWTFTVVFLSVACFSFVLQNWLFRPLSHWERIVLLAAGFGLVHESRLTDFISFLLALLVYLNQAGLIKKIVQWRPASNKKE